MRHRKLILVGLIFWSTLVAGCATNKATASVSITPTATDKPSETLRPNPSPSGTPQPTTTSTPNPSPTVTLTPTPLDPRANLEPGLYVVYWSQKVLYIHSITKSLKVSWLTVGDKGDVRLSSDGQKLAFSDRGSIYTYDLTTGVKTLVVKTGENEDVYGPKWAPDGERLIYTFDRNPPVDPSIYIASLLDNTIIPVTTWSTVERDPAWSPDGKWIAFASDQAKINNPGGSFLGVTELYVMDANCLATPSSCTDRLRQLTDMGLSGDSDNPAWSPDSQSLLFTCGGLIDDDYQKDICSVDLDGSHLRHLTETQDDELWPAWSPDGEYIAFTREGVASNAGEVFIMSASGENLTNITNSPDEDEIFVFWLVVK